MCFSVRSIGRNVTFVMMSTKPCEEPDGSTCIGGGGGPRHDLLFTVYSRYLWSKESFVCLVWWAVCEADCLFANIAVARIAFFFADSPRYLYTPLSLCLCLVFVHLFPVTLVAPSPLFSVPFRGG